MSFDNQGNEQNRERLRDFVERAAPLAALASVVLMFAQVLPGLWNHKAFLFLIGEACFVAAITYSAQLPFGKFKFAPYGVAIWYFNGTIHLARALWLTQT